MEELVTGLIAIVLVGLRIAPTLAFAPPFTLMRIPVPVRVLLALALALGMTEGQASHLSAGMAAGRSLVTLAAGELFVGMALALALQLAFGAISWIGGAVDTQAGFGFAMIADPAHQSEIPLAGTIFSYATGLIFFTMGGAYDLLALWHASLEALPLGQARLGGDMAALSSLLGVTFSLALGMFGLVMLTLFLLDITIAFMSRTLPQMNMLLLGFQVKSLAMLVMLPITFALSAGIALRLLRIALESAPLLIASGG